VESLYGPPEKTFIMSISLGSSPFLLKIPLHDFKAELNEENIDTFWGIFLKALKKWMRKANYISNEEEILPEDNYHNKDQQTSLDPNIHIEATLKCTFLAEKEMTRLKHADFYSIGETKLWLESLLLNYFYTFRKFNGRSLMIFEPNSKDVFTLKTSSLVIGISKAKKEFQQLMVTSIDRVTDEPYIKLLEHRWIKSLEFYANELKDILKSLLVKRFI
jgi:hypothetical protein